jgi:Protein of unknown function (DUF1552)
MIRPHRISRRFLLRGSAGACIALPFLNAMESRAAPATSPQRFVFVFGPNGVDRQQFRPASTGQMNALPPLLETFGATNVYDKTKTQESLLNDILVVSGLQNTIADNAGQHASGTAGLLTCQRARTETDLRAKGLSVAYVGEFPEGNQNPRAVSTPVSFDYVLADELRKLAPASSGVWDPLNLGTEGPSNGSDADLRGDYMNYISWKTPTSFAPNQIDLKAIFQNLVASPLSGNDQGAEFERRKKSRLLVLDQVNAQLKSLSSRVGVEDRITLDRYFTSLSSVEKKIQNQTQDANTANCPAMPQVPNDNGSVTRRVEAMFELMKLVMQCDRKRIMTFMLKNSRSFVTLDSPYVTIRNRANNIASFHGASHWGRQQIEQFSSAAVAKEAWSAYVRWEMFVLANFVRLLKATPEAGGTLLDSTVVMFSSEISDGDDHDHFDMPVLLAGKGGGSLKPGRHLRFEGKPLANLYLTLAQRCFSAALSRFGNSNGTLDGLG